MLDTASILADIANVIAEMPSTMTVNAKAYSVMLSNNYKTKQYTENGGKPGYKMSAVVCTTDTFSVGDKATIGTATYRILDVDVGAVQGLQTIHLGSEF